MRAYGKIPIANIIVVWSVSMAFRKRLLLLIITYGAAQYIMSMTSIILSNEIVRKNKLCILKIIEYYNITCSPLLTLFKNSFFKQNSCNL